MSYKTTIGFLTSNDIGFPKILSLWPAPFEIIHSSQKIKIIGIVV